MQTADTYRHDNWATERKHMPITRAWRKWRVKWLIEQLCYYLTLVLGDSEVLRMPPLRQAPNRCAESRPTANAPAGFRTSAGGLHPQMRCRPTSGGTPTHLQIYKIPQRKSTASPLGNIVNPPAVVRHAAKIAHKVCENRKIYLKFLNKPNFNVPKNWGKIFGKNA